VPPAATGARERVWIENTVVCIQEAKSGRSLRAQLMLAQSNTLCEVLGS
jgi:hypothetical protein